MLPEIGELVFSFVVGYMGALEFLYVVRHLYHWSFQHNPEMRDLKSEADSLHKLQDHLRNSISEASEKEALGLKAMKDGVLYKDGFRVNADQKEIDELKDKIRMQEQTADRQREIEAELARQRKIEEETRKQLKQAEDELRRMEEEKERDRSRIEREKEEKQRAEEERRRAEEEENERRILEAEKKKEEEQRRLEEEENAKRLKREDHERENTRKLLEAEREQEEKQRQLEADEENARKLLEAEREREEKQRQQDLEEQQRLQDLADEEIIRKLLEAERQREEEEENARRLLEAEQKREENERLRELEEENNRKLLEAERELEEEKRRLEDEHARQRIEEEENYRRLLQAERDIEEREREAEEERKALLEHAAALERETAERLLAAEREAENKQREIEENEETMRNLLEAERKLEQKKREMEEEAETLRQLIEAEKEMEERQRRIDEEALQKLKNAEEEVELRLSYDEAAVSEQPVVKKEIGHSEQSPTQTVKTQYGQTGSESIKPKTLLFPGVSEESSSAEPVSSLQSSFSTQQSSEAVVPELYFDEYERQAPDGGEDMPSLQYSDDYLRSLDGIKNKPLVREDGSGRRRAFKKRRSSGSSTSSRESRASREEELKMFTSLEEEEFENIRKGDSEYETIKYASEPNLKVGKPHRRHKRSPAKDGKRDASDATKGSLEMLDEEDSNPWGEGKPEHYKDSEFWKREKNLSIEEERDETEARQRLQSPNPSAVNVPKMSSFEEATRSQHEEAISVLQRQRSKDPEPIKQSDEESDTKNVSRVSDARLSPAGSNSSPASASASISPALISPEPVERETSQESERIASRTPSPTSSGVGLRRSPRVDEMKQYKEQWKSVDLKARVEAGENPAIEIDYASDDELMPEQEYLMEGISDFYDFNASINPSRSRSRTRSRSRSVSPHQRRTPSPQNVSHKLDTTKSRSPSPDPASYKFIYQRILPNLAAEDQPDQKNMDGLSDFNDLHSELNQESLTGMMTERSDIVHRTSMDYVMEDLSPEKLNDKGAIAKQIIELQQSPTTPEYERSISAEWRDTEKLKEELLSGAFKRSTYVGESMDFSDQFENLREEAKTFRRSRSKSRSPVYDNEEMTNRVLAKKQLQDKVLEEIAKTAENSKEFASEITTIYVDRNRRASDTVLIQKPEILFQIQEMIQESDEQLDIPDLEPEEYHHFRRFSLNQETPTEQYPDDFVAISELKVQSMVNLRTYSDKVEAELPPVPQEDVSEDPYESGSDDERQTVVEVEDEIDEDIWDCNEQPEDSHNEQSECEEADREIDRYAGRHADDWRDVEGAVGGVSDEDSFQIDQIYDEAIKNRKPSVILRDYDSILQEIQVSDEDRLDVEQKEEISNGNGGNFDRGLWSPRSRSSRASSGESSRSFLENERRDAERRYLGDATMSAINSTRLRSRYGIVPSTSFTTTYDDETVEVDVNYIPKREYNWRKNFKLDEDEGGEESENHTQYLDSRKFSLGGESITLFSRSPILSEEETDMHRVVETNEDGQEQQEEEMEQEQEELAGGKTSKKKKNKRKSRKGSKGSIGVNDEDVETASRTDSTIKDGDLPKKKSRRESKGNIEVVIEKETPLDDEEMEDSQPKKKSKKRRKAKQETTLPNLRLPTPEKKVPPPSVAAIRAALISAPAEVKPEPVRKSPKISKPETTLPNLNMQLPSPEKKTPPPSVAAIRAALIAPPVEFKHERKSPKLEDLIGTKALRNERSSVSPKIEQHTIPPVNQDDNPSLTSIKSPTTDDIIGPQATSDVNQNTSTTRTSPSPQPKQASIVMTNGETSHCKTSEPSHSPVRTPSPSQNLATQSKDNKPSPSKSPSDPVAIDIIKDGGLYPLF